ncbi:MAG: orotate phosphoribosyltransferase [Bacteroidetes bacterium]|nr:orotate phosphoribosyltransferase [Bacteroidota bacterium]
MTKQELAKEIYNASYIEGEFKLRSGIVSNQYFDKYQFESDPILLKEITKYFASMLNKNHNEKNIGYDFLAGLEVGGIPIATALGINMNIPMVFVRKNAKEYGTAKLVEGPDIKNKKLLIVEDVVTSGGQIIKSVQYLRNEGALITHAICVIDREQGGKEALKEIDIELLPLFTMDELKF